MKTLPLTVSIAARLHDVPARMLPLTVSEPVDLDVVADLDAAVDGLASSAVAPSSMWMLPLTVSRSP